MTRGKERESTRVPSLGTEFTIKASNNNVINALYRYIDPNDSVDFNRIETFIRNNFSVFNPYKHDRHGSLVISRNLAERIEHFTSLSRQINMLIKQGVEFYRDQKINAQANNWIVRIVTPILKSSTKVELETLYLSTVSWKELKAADETPTKLNERFINIKPTQEESIYRYQYGYHPHINTSGQPCFGAYMIRLNDYAVQGSIVGYFSTLRQWANTSNSRDAFWNLPGLIRDVSGRTMAIKKKRHNPEEPYMYRKISYILPIKVLLQMKDAWQYPFEGNNYYNHIREGIGRTRIATNSFRELGRYYVNKYNRNPQRFKYNEEEVLDRTRAYSILYALIRNYLIDSVEHKQELRTNIDNFHRDYFPLNRSNFATAFQSTLNKNVEPNSKMFDHLKGSVDELGDVVRTFVMEARNALRNNSYKFYDTFNKIMEYGWFRYKNINSQFTEEMNVYTHYYLAAMYIKNMKDDYYLTKVLHMQDLFKIKHWFSLSEINDFYKRLMGYKPAGKTRFLKKMREEVIPAIYSYSEYEDVLINEYWDIEPRLGHRLESQRTLWGETNIEKLRANKIAELKYSCEIEDIFKEFNEMVMHYQVYEESDIAKLQDYMEYVVMNMLYEWTSHTFNVKAKEANYAIEARRKVQKGFKKFETKEGKERTNNIAEDASESTVPAISV